MFSVIFEVLPNEGKKEAYLELAKHLKPILETIDGFVDNERFESRLRPGWVLSHSTWRDEKSVVRWRTEGEHHATQAKGRYDIFRPRFWSAASTRPRSARPSSSPSPRSRRAKAQPGPICWPTRPTCCRRVSVST